MIINMNPSDLDGIVRAWLKDTLKTLEDNFSAHYVHPDDYKTYKKDIKAVKRMLDYVGEPL